MLTGKDEQYPVLPEREKCLLRPDMYIGSIKPESVSYIYMKCAVDPASPRPIVTTERRVVNVCSALLQLVLEITTNATDHSFRDDSVRNIRISTNAETGSIQVFNDGSGLPVRAHDQFPHRMVPDVVFSEPNSSSNYDDTKQRRGAGRNGSGGKLANWWSKEFEVETCDAAAGRIFRMRWTDNGQGAPEPPSIKSTSRKTGYTKISFTPDYDRLNLSRENMAELMDYINSSLWSVAAVTNKKITVTLNEEKLPVRSVLDYAKILAGPNEPVAYDEVPDFQVCVWSAVHHDAPIHLGFVNSIPCNKGTHIAHAVSRLSKALDVTETVFQHNCCMVVNVSVPNPSFSSQCKTHLKTSWRDASSPKYEVSDAMKNALRRNKIAQEIQMAQQFTEDRKASKGVAKAAQPRQGPISVLGYHGAKHAGKTSYRRKGGKCALILTEGLSALNFVLTGRQGDGLGAFPLRGKVINPRGKTLKKVLENEEIKHLFTILGVRSVIKGQRPEQAADLRYDNVWVLADQDTDGAHIVALVVNVFAYFFPELMRNCPGFVCRFATPLIRAIPKAVDSHEPVMEFMTRQAFDDWYAAQSDAVRRRYEPKYYKGLGTSTARDAKRCFQHTDDLVISLTLADQRDWDILDDFFGSQTLRRKRIIGHALGRIDDMQEAEAEAEADATAGADAGAAHRMQVDYTQRSIALYDYMMREYMAFPIDDCERSLPSAVDGLLIVMRKILYTIMVKYRALRRPNLRISQLAAAAAEFTGYHHGETSVSGSATNMGRDAHLSCNINLLVPSGQYGTRHVRKAAQPRYLFTCAEEIVSALFPYEDMPVLTMVEEEGQRCEPVNYVPVIPYILVNGKTGAIGTGYSCELPPHNVKDIVAWCRAYAREVNHETPAGTARSSCPIRPWMEGFTGPITQTGGTVTFHGQIHRDADDACAIRVTELPVTTDIFWNNDMKDPSAAKHIKWISDNQAIMTMTGDVNTVDLTVQFPGPVTDDQLSYLRARGTTTFSYTNMNLWTHDHRLRKFESVYDIAEYHATQRLGLNQRRRQHQLQELQETIDRCSDEYRFVQMCIDSHGKLVFKRPRRDVESDLAAANLKPRKVGKPDGDQQQQVNDDAGNPRASYDYLLHMQIQSFTAETLARLQARVETHRDQHRTLAAKTAIDLWIDDLDRFEAAYDRFVATRAHRRANPDTPDDLESQVGRPPTKKRKAASHVAVKSKRPKHV